MNTSLLLMAGVALLLAGCWVKSSSIYKWICGACALLLAIQPVVAALKWVGGLVGL